LRADTRDDQTFWKSSDLHVWAEFQRVRHFCSPNRPDCPPNVSVSCRMIMNVYIPTGNKINRVSFLI
jgi:hypothetical protein